MPKYLLLCDVKDYIYEKLLCHPPCENISLCGKGGHIQLNISPDILIQIDLGLDPQKEDDMFFQNLG